MLREGKSYAAVGRHDGLNESTIRFIKKDEANISTVDVSYVQTAKRVSTARNKNIVRMESALAVWITDCIKKKHSIEHQHY